MTSTTFTCRTRLRLSAVSRAMLKGRPARIVATDGRYFCPSYSCVIGASVFEVPLTSTHSNLPQSTTEFGSLLQSAKYTSPM